MTYQRLTRDISASPSEDIATANPLVPTWSIDFTQQSPASAGLSFSRASNAGFYDRNANWVTALTNTLRVSHNPANGLVRGFLCEESRTNHLRNSTAPATQTISLSTGSYAFWLEGSGSCTLSAGTAAGSGFGTTTAGNVRLLTIGTAGTVTFTVNGSLTRFQCENGLTATSFIATAGAAATRAADVASLSISSLFNPQQGTFVYVAGTSNVSSGNTLGLDDDTGANTSYVNAYIRDTVIGLFFRISGVTVSDLKLFTSRPVGTQGKVAFSYSPQGTRLCINNQMFGTSSSSSAGISITHLRIGHRNNGSSLSHINEHIQRVDYFNTALSTAQLQQLTA